MMHGPERRVEINRQAANQRGFCTEARTVQLSYFPYAKPDQISPITPKAGGIGASWRCLRDASYSSTRPIQRSKELCNRKGQVRHCHWKEEASQGAVAAREPRSDRLLP